MPEGMLQGRHILVVEDEYFLADELQITLEDAGAEMLGPVASVQGGLRILEGSTLPDAASLDVSLGGETVYPLCGCPDRARRAVRVHHGLRPGGHPVLLRPHPPAGEAGRTRDCAHGTRKTLPSLMETFVVSGASNPYWVAGAPRCLRRTGKREPSFLHDRKDGLCGRAVGDSGTSLDIGTG